MIIVVRWTSLKNDRALSGEAIPVDSSDDARGISCQRQLGVHPLVSSNACCA